MAKTTNGNCTNCGRKGVLSVLHGGKVCNTCRYLLAAANNNIPALAGAVRTVGKTEEMIKALIPDGGSLAVQVTATLLQEISGIVGYDGEEPAELVEAVRKRALTCASCEAEDVLREIRQVVGYTPEQSDKGLADMVRRLVEWPSVDCGKCTTQRDDLDRSTRVIEELRAELTIAQQARDEWEQRAMQAEANVADQAAELSKDDTSLRDELTRSGAEVEQLRDKLQAAESRLIWYRAAIATLRERLGLDHLDEDEDVMERMLEAITGAAFAVSRHQDLATAAEQRADHLQDQVERLTGANEAQARVERELRAELDRLREQIADAACVTDETPLLDIALAVIREEPVPAEQIAGLIEAARRAV